MERTEYEIIKSIETRLDRLEKKLDQDFKRLYKGQAHLDTMQDTLDNISMWAKENL